MKYLNFPDLDGTGTFTICQTCFTPSMEIMLVMIGGQVTDDFDDMVRQMDELQIRDFGAQDEMRPDIVDEVAGLVCEKCGREGINENEEASA